jgi:hypothetical protein
MKKLLTLLSVAFLITGCCFSQLPTQYAYVDENCIAMVPDFTGMVIVSDNCGIATMSQVPPPGDPIMETTQVFIRATDDQGNERSMNFEMILLDTIAPLMQINPDWVGYSDKEVGNMYKVFYGWVQEKGDEYNELVAGTIDTIQLPDTTLVHVNDTMRYFFGTIPIFEYRMDEGYWANETPDLTAWFK